VSLRAAPFGTGLFGRTLAAIGGRTLRWLDATLAFTAFCATAFATALRRRSWQRPMRATFYDSLNRVTVQSIPTVIVTGVLLGFALVTQVVYWLQTAGQTQLVGVIVERLLVREIAPVVTGLIIFGRVGTRILIDLGDARSRGWLRQLERQGIDPMALIVTPRLMAFGIGAFCLGTMLMLSTLLSGYIVASMLGLVSFPIWTFMENLLRAMDGSDFIIQPLKCITMGMAVALVCCATALGRADETYELQRLVQRGFVRATLAILLINGVFDLAG
jgi:phospholipid/cholesterol/gamma-HCH transport system permease protein